MRFVAPRRHRQRRTAVQHLDEHASATTLELFFDLVFVFALTQVTALMAHDLTATGLLQGSLITAIIWWCWVCFSWLGNLVRADVGAARAAMFIAMGGMFVLALAIPEAFHDLPGGLHGPTTFAAGYLCLRFVHIVLLIVLSGDDPALRHQVAMFAVTMSGSTLLLLYASRFDGGLELALWALVLLVDYGGNFAIGDSGWRLRAPRHFAERHGLIIIVALGESIAALGVGVSGAAISWPIVAAAVLGLSVSASLWWAYFDVVSTRAEGVLAHTRGHRQVTVAQVAYTYLHLPMIAGIVFVALGLKRVLEQAGAVDPDTASAPLPSSAAVALYGGAAAFLLTSAAFSAHAGRVTPALRVAVAVGLVAAAPAARSVPALTALALLAGTMVALNAGESRQSRRPARPTARARPPSTARHR
jgi:low temperature requirement protein LtrA